VLAPGDRIHSMQTLARDFSVSKKIVECAFNLLEEEHLIVKMTGRRGTFIRKDIGLSSANGSARQDATSNSVCMVVPEKGDLYENIFRRISGHLLKRGLYHIVVSEGSYYDDVEGLSTFISRIAADNPFGFIIDGHDHVPYEFIKENLSITRNLVFVNRYHWHEDIPGAKFALVDYEKAGEIAAEHLWSMGHRTVSFFALPEKKYHEPTMWNSIQIRILTGFRNMCRKKGLSFDEGVAWRLILDEPFEKIAGEIFSASQAPTGLFAYGDSNAVEHVMPVLARLNLRVPEDVSIVGLYDTPHAVNCPCPLTSISICEDTIADVAFNLLINGKPGEKILVQPKLIERASVIKRCVL